MHFKYTYDINKFKDYFTGRKFVVHFLNIFLIVANDERMQLFLIKIKKNTSIKSWMKKYTAKKRYS